MNKVQKIKPKTNRQYERMGGACVMALVPLLYCVIRCALDGQVIWNIYLPSSTWNDELFYFKQVEAILMHGFPQGFFGFNESQALHLSFAAWSPVLLIPWVIWGFLFGWNYQSPIYCNIFLTMLAVFLFVYITRLTRKQMLLLAVMLGCFTPLTRYMFACMPEIIIFTLIIVYMAETLKYCEDKKTHRIAVMFIMASVATLMRPYCLMFLLLPAWFWFLKNKWIGSICSGIIGIVTGIVYLLISHNFAAAYFSPIYDVTWYAVLKNQGIGACVDYLIYYVGYIGTPFGKMLTDGISKGLFAGAVYVVFLLVVVLVVCIAINKIKKKEKNRVIYIHFAICSVGMLGAVLLMYKLSEGSRHMALFVVVGIFLIAAESERIAWKPIVLSICMAYLFIVMAKEPENYALPYKTSEMMERLNQMEITLKEEMEYSESAPTYDNTIIWLYSDQVADITVTLKWQYLYAITGDYGISICETSFVTENFEKLQSKYIATVVNGTVDLLCKEQSKNAIYKNDEIVIYALR